MASTKWLSKMTSAGKARRGCVTSGEVVWILTRQGHINQVSTRGRTNGLTRQGNDRTWVPYKVSVKAIPIYTFLPTEKMVNMIMTIYITLILQNPKQKSWWWNSEQPESGGVAPMDPVAVTRPPKKVNLASPVTFSPLLWPIIQCRYVNISSTDLPIGSILTSF